MNHNLNDLQRLNAMGIRVWQVRNPDFFIAQNNEKIILPSACKLLYVSDYQPNKSQLAFFVKILASIKLTLKDVLYLPREAVLQLESIPALCWFAGVEPLALNNTHVLTSCSLHKLEHNTESKRHLWEQIKNYDKASSS